MLNKLQFLHTRENKIFPDKDEALNYLIEKSDKKSLYAEPLVMRYGKNGENLLLVIGASGNGVDDKKDFFVIDNAQTIKDLAALDERLGDVEISAHVTTEETPTIKLDATKGDTSTVVKGDVKIGKYDIVDGEVDPTKKNILKINEDGLFTYINLDYVDNELQFTVNEKTKTFPIANEDYVVSAKYDIKTESLILTRKGGEEVTCNLSALIQEWTVEGAGSKTPIVLRKERVVVDPETNQYQDILRGDIRIADDVDFNILKIERSGKALYVQGTADNIMFDSTTTVKKAIENKFARVSLDDNNLLYNKADGIYGNVNLAYDSTQNMLIFTRSKHDGTIETKNISLAGVEIIDHIDYHPSTKILEIWYKDNTGKLQRVPIDMTDLLASLDWVAQNDGHSVVIRKIATDNTGNQQVSADVRISELDDNILTEVAHHLYVKGTADNIQYNETTNVKEAIASTAERLDDAEGNISALKDAELADKAEIKKNADAIAENADAISGLKNDLQVEIGRATAEENRLGDLIDSLDKEVDDLTKNVADADNKIAENTDDIKDINDKIGEGFSIRHTVADAIKEVSDNLQNEIDRALAKEGELNLTISSVKAEADENKGDIEALKNTSKIKVVNLGHTVELQDNTADGHELSADVKISAEDGNIIKTNTDGVYANVALDYNAATNTLTFTSSNNESKTIQLLSKSLLKNIYYDPILESIVFVYEIDGQEKTLPVSVRSMLDEWDAASTSTVKLTKKINASTQGEPAKDILTADVIICPENIHSDNILKNDNGLYVSGKQIAENTAAIEALGGNIGNVKDLIDAEKAERIAKDTELEGKILDNKASIEGVKGDINEINGEIDDINEKLKGVATDANIKDLSDKLAQEIQDRTNGDRNVENAYKAADEVIKSDYAEKIANAVATEKNQREASDTRLESLIQANTTAINGEIQNRKDEDAALKSDYIERITNAISNEKEQRTSKDASLEELINGNANAIAAETKNRKDEDAKLQDAIDSAADAIRQEKNDRKDEDTKLKSELKDYTDTEIKKVAKYTFDDTNTLDLNVAADGKVTGNVLIANSNDNIIKASNDPNKSGIYASASLSYDAATNTLTFSTSNGTETPITLNAGSIIDSMEVVEEGGIKYILISYRTTDGSQNTIRINVSDLLSEIKAVNPENEPVWLTVDNSYTGGGTSISAHLIISNAHDDNILVIDGNNGLYVSGEQIEINKVDIENLKKKLNDYQEEIDNIEKAAGINEDGTYNRNVNINAHYITNSDSLTTSDLILDQKVYDATTGLTEVNNKINNLDASRVGADGSYIKYVEQEDGKVKAESKTFDTVVNSDSTDTNAPTSNAVYKFVTAHTSNLLDGLDGNVTAQQNQFVKSVVETDGKITGTVENFINVIDSTTSGSTVAPETKAVYNFVTSETKNAISGLDQNPIGELNSYIKYVSEADGIVSAVPYAFDSEITSTSSENNTPSTKAIYNFVTGYTGGVDNLNGGVSGDTGEFIQIVTETKGIVTGKAEPFVSAITETTKNSLVAPQTKAVAEYIEGKLQFDDSIVTHQTSTNAPQTKAVYEYVNSAFNNIKGEAGTLDSLETYVNYVVLEDGTLSGQEQTFVEEINEETSGSTVAPQTQAVVNYVNGKIKNINDKLDELDLEQVGADGSYIKYVKQENGKVSAETQQFDSEISKDSTSANTPSSKAVYDYVGNVLSDLIGTLSAETVGGDEDSYIYAVEEHDGVVSASGRPFDNHLDSASTRAVQNAVVTNTFNKIKDAVGLNDDFGYDPHNDSFIISGADDIDESIVLLDEYVRRLDSDSNVRANGYFVTGLRQDDGKITLLRDTAFISGITYDDECGALDNDTDKIAPSTKAVKEALVWAEEEKNDGEGNTYYEIHPRHYWKGECKAIHNVKADAFYEYSDQKLKENISKIGNDDINKVKNVTLKEYSLKADKSHTKKYGVIAQELEQNGLGNLVSTSDGIKSVDYISLLILKIQQLENEIKELKENK